MREARDVVAKVADRLSRSGAPSPGPEARTLVAHALGVEPAALLTALISPGAEAALGELVARREAGEPVQHITGVAHFRHETLSVGPGVFIPRPETEAMVGWALNRLAERPADRRVVVELCAGSGAITAALGREVGGLRLHAVELSPEAWPYLERNLAGLDVELELGDMADAFPTLDGAVDLVIANPPYVPETHRHLLPTDVVEHDPGLALFSGPDGLAATRVVARVARRLLRPGGLVASEHDESHPEAAARIFAAAGFAEVTTHLDLARRPRYVTGVAGWRA